MGVVQWGLLGVVLLQVAAAELSYFRYNGEEFLCMPQRYVTPTSPEFNIVNQRVTRVRNGECSSADGNCCGACPNIGFPADEISCDNVELNTADLEQVNGTVALLEASACHFENAEYYTRDYRTKILEVKVAGAVGVIFGELYPSKIGSFMSGTTNEELPVCLLDSSILTRLKQTTMWATEDPPTTKSGFNFESATLYTTARDEDMVPIPKITKVLVNEQWKADGPNGFDFPILGFSTTFNPRDIASISGKMVVAEWAPACSAATSFAECISCWMLDSPFLQGSEMNNRMVLIRADREDFPVCFTNDFQHAIFASRRGALGLMISYRYPARIPGMYLAPENFTMSTYKIMGAHADALEHALAEADPAMGVMVTLPEVVDSMAPAYVAPIDPDERDELGATVLGVWTVVDDMNREWGATFQCFAGQAKFNPLSHPGIAPPTHLGETAGLVMRARPTAACADASRCGDCLASGDHIDREHLIEQGPNETSILLIDLDDWPCYLEYAQLTAVAVEADASALVIINPPPVDGMTYVVYTLGMSGVNDNSFISPIPVFNIDASCGARLEDGGRYLMHIPEIVNGAAVEDEVWEDFVTDNLAQTDVLGQATLMVKDAEIFAGQAEFNPSGHARVLALLLVVQPVDACNAPGSQYDCLPCDKEPNKFKHWESGEVVQSSEIQGKIVMMLHTYCFHPFINTVFYLQNRGAAGVVYINPNESLVTITQTEVPYTITIPTFNVGHQAGLDLVAKAAVEPIVMRLPSIIGGVAVTPEDTLVVEEFDMPYTVGDNGELLFEIRERVEMQTAENGGGGGSAALGLAVGLPIGLCLAGSASAGYWYMRRKKIWVYNQLDTGVQTGEAFLDITSGGTDDWDDRGDNFDNSYAESRAGVPSNGNNRVQVFDVEH
mmetsp:Transcript_15153/g.32618  ORF Transcript_15153/g.32618 Transcript_15153/m.32618 type:complete len:898 (-) Transcript_15153:1020-3713(-)|eukprot:CAMPEP_0118922012 /NCGR_PEP_ID=MMETSP1169-20130426/1097_1 /TAXON_ID=36882 /ORGANISM="Pyramimonas obovata, Strain CCMP722" /LENGTH=897 /DNA_ID=CAMNT_0006862825 /DNA_START=258 /DNA_END=2951 /DNA_ORIENTATION=-